MMHDLSWTILPGGPSSRRLISDHLHIRFLGARAMLLSAVGHGATNVISDLDTFDPAGCLALVDRRRVTHAAFLAPTMLRRLTDKASELGWRSETLRSMMIGVRRSTSNPAPAAPASKDIPDIPYLSTLIIPVRQPSAIGSGLVTRPGEPQAVAAASPETEVTPTPAAAPRPNHDDVTSSLPGPPRCHIVVAEPCEPDQEDLADAMDTFGPVVGQMYGQGESPMTIAVMPPGQLTARRDANSNWRSCGRPFTGVEVRIGPGLTPAALGEQGEIFVRGDVVMARYWDDQKATTEAIQSG